MTTQRRNVKAETATIAHAVVPLDALAPHPRNYRQHPQQQLDRLASSPARFGQVRSIVVQEGPSGYLIVAGHGLVEAARRRGLVDLRADVIPATWTPEQVEGYLIADNQHAAGAQDDLVALAEMLEAQYAADYDLESLGSSREDLDALLEELANRALQGAPQRDVDDPDGGGDDFDTTPDEDGGPTRVQPGDLWQLGEHRLLCGDSTKREDVARLMDGETARLVVTSPPYNQQLDTFRPSGMQRENPAFVQRMASAYADSRPEDEYQDAQVALLEMLPRFLTPDASIFYNHKIRYREKAVVSPMLWLSRLSYPIRQEIIWDRSSSITLNARMFMPADERIYWLRVGDDFVFNDAPDIKAWGTVWTIAARNEVQVSAAFAVEIPARCIAAASDNGDIVLEPYGGSGTTLIAAERLGRVCYAIEIDPRYCDVILRRWEAETGRAAVLLDRVSAADEVSA